MAERIKEKTVKKTMKALLLLLPISTAMTITAAAGTEYVNSKEGLLVRSKPDESGEVLAKIYFGDAVEILDKEEHKGWYRIDFEDKDAYVSAEYTQETNPLDDLTYMGEWRITAYAATGNPCANGNFPQTGYTIACNSLPFGTEVYIDGVGFRTVEDRGPEWLGSEWLDIYMGEVEPCVQWGDQYREVYIVEEEP